MNLEHARPWRVDTSSGCSGPAPWAGSTAERPPPPLGAQEARTWVHALGTQAPPRPPARSQALLGGPALGAASWVLAVSFCWNSTSRQGSSSLRGSVARGCVPSVPGDGSSGSSEPPALVSRLETTTACARALLVPGAPSCPCLLRWLYCYQ